MDLARRSREGPPLEAAELLALLRTDVPFLALRESFKSVGDDERQRIYDVSHGHWSPAGHRLVAEALKDLVVREFGPPCETVE